MYEPKKGLEENPTQRIDTCSLPDWCESMPEGLRRLLSIISVDEDWLKKKTAAGRDYATIIMISSLASLDENHWG